MTFERSSLVAFPPPFPTFPIRVVRVFVGLPSLGFQRYPSTVFQPRSPLPESVFRGSPSDPFPGVRREIRLRTLRRESCQLPRMFRSRGFSPPQRFSPPLPRGFIPPRYRSEGSPRFTPPRRGDSRDAFLPYRAFHPSAAMADGFPPSMGSRHHPALSSRCSPRSLPSRPFAVLPGFPFHIRAGPQGLAPRTATLRIVPLPARPARCSPGLGSPSIFRP